MLNKYKRFSAVQCSAVQRSIVQCSLVQCSVVQGSVVQCSAVHRSAAAVSVRQCWDNAAELAAAAATKIDGKLVAELGELVGRWSSLK